MASPMCIASAAAVAPIKLWRGGHSDNFVFLQVKNGFLDFFTQEDKSMKSSTCARSLSADSVMSRGRFSASTSASTRSERSSSPSGRSTRESGTISIGSTPTPSPRCHTEAHISFQQHALADGAETFHHQALQQQWGGVVSLVSALVQKEPAQVPARAAKKDLSKLRNRDELVTTVMVRGIPCSLSQERLMEILNLAGFAGLYDFFYLPRAGKSGSNFGYAFVNFVDPAVAANCQAAMHGVALDPVRSQKTCTISPADIQGLENLRKHFRRTAVSRNLRGPVYLKTQTQAA